MSKLRWVSFSALDTLMFRDGRPFNQDDEGAAEIRSLFPPWPPTLIGALRAAIWHGPLRGSWDKNKLGDGTDWYDDKSLGPLEFTPTILTRNNDPIFPAPLNLLHDAIGNITLLRPGPAVDCDLGLEVRLPEPVERLNGGKIPEQDFVGVQGLKKVLNGRACDAKDLIAANDLYLRESRVGIGINPNTRRVNDGQIYVAAHVRPIDRPATAGTSSELRIAVGLDGFDGDLPESLMPMGGEHRMVSIASANDIALPQSIAPANGRRLAVAISPVVLDELPGPGADFFGLGKVVSACLGKAERIGGWDSGNRRSLPMRFAIPAGSVWYLEDAPQANGMQGTISIGHATKWGFGALLLGKWEDDT